MAKKATVKTAGSSVKASAPKSNAKVFEFSKLNDFLSKEVNPIGSLVETNEFINTKEFISSGIYVLDAALSTKLVGGGIPNNKVIGIGGESGCLYPTEKLNIYTMKTKNKNRSVYGKENLES